MPSLSFIRNSVLYACAAASLSQALSLPSGISRRSGSSNAPDSRNLWSEGFDIDTNYYDKWPNTGNTVKYDLHLTEEPCNPDGHGDKMCELWNGQYPGPTIRANWGDTIQVTVHNQLTNNGTSVHWHGVRQLGSNEMDGTNGMTECPIAPGTTRTYEFVATQYGTSWYHSHHTAQYGQGCAGPIVIDGPSTANYDEDLGVLPLADWYYASIWDLLVEAMHIHGPIPSDNVLINGTMVDGNGQGSYQTLSVEPGKKYKLRFVNTAMDHLFHVSLDGHPFTVVSADFVPIKPYQTTDLKINVGQRYEIIFETNQDAANYWLRVGAGPVGPQGPVCGQANIYTNPSKPVVGAIVSYSGAPSGLPTSTAYGNDGTCNDEVFEPYFATPMSGGYNLDALSIASGNPNDSVVHWYINGSTMNIDWEHPTLSYVENNADFVPSMNVIEMPKANSWYLWVIENALNPPIPHPIHLHGHDFEVLGSGVGTFPWGQDFSTVPNPVRRDVATLPGAPSGGWLLLGVYTDNPGAWLMHCHIGWHASQGLSLQFVEQKSQIVKSIGSLDSMNQGCEAWTSYWNSTGEPEFRVDSGI